MQGRHSAIHIEMNDHITSHLDVNAVTDDQGQRVLQGWKLLIATPQTARLNAQSGK